jgi:hypothetical protein
MLRLFLPSGVPTWRTEAELQGIGIGAVLGELRTVMQEALLQHWAVFCGQGRTRSAAVSAFLKLALLLLFLLASASNCNEPAKAKLAVDELLKMEDDFATTTLDKVRAEMDRSMRQRVACRVEEAQHAHSTSGTFVVDRDDRFWDAIRCFSIGDCYEAGFNAICVDSPAHVTRSTGMGMGGDGTSGHGMDDADMGMSDDGTSGHGMDDARTRIFPCVMHVVNGGAIITPTSGDAAFSSHLSGGSGSAHSESSIFSYGQSMQDAEEEMPLNSTQQQWEDLGYSGVENEISPLRSTSYSDGENESSNKRQKRAQ